MRVEYVVPFCEELPDFDSVIAKLTAVTRLRLSHYEVLFHFDGRESERSWRPPDSYHEAYKIFLQDKESSKHIGFYNVKCDEPVIEEFIVVDKCKKTYEMHVHHPDAEYLLVSILFVLITMGGEYRRIMPTWAGKPWNAVDEKAGLYHKWNSMPS